MSEAALRSSADLRAELAQVDIDIMALDGRLSSADAQIRGHALLARRGDAAAVKQVAEARSQKVAIGVEIDFTSAARVALTAELQAALEREAAELRRRAADEARAFADALEPVGGALDKAIGDFKDGYLGLKRRLHAAEQAGHGPGAAVVGAAMTQALRCVLWSITELAIPPGQGARHTFAYLTKSWAGASRGAAVRMLAPPATKPNGANGAKPAVQSKPADRSIPKQVDASAPLPGDDPAFTVYADRNEADKAVAAAAAGPKDGGKQK